MGFVRLSPHVSHTRDNKRLRTQIWIQNNRNMEHAQEEKCAPKCPHEWCMRERNAHAPVVPWVELAEAARPPVEQRRARPVASVGVRALKSCNGRKRPKIFKNIIERGPITHRRHFSVITKSAREKITGSTHKILAIPSVDDQSIFFGENNNKKYKCGGIWRNSYQTGIQQGWRFMAEVRFSRLFLCL